MRVIRSLLFSTLMPSAFRMYVLLCTHMRRIWVSNERILWCRAFFLSSALDSFFLFPALPQIRDNTINIPQLYKSITIHCLVRFLRSFKILCAHSFSFYIEICICFFCIFRLSFHPISFSLSLSVCVSSCCA